MIAELFVLAIFPLLLAIAAGWDVASFTIPNAIPLALIATFAVFAVATHFSFAQAGSHLAGGAIGLVVGFLLFAIGYIGGGDAKLFAGAALWFGIPDLLPYALLATIMGGALALLLMGMRRLPLPAFLVREAWLARLHDAKSGIPYGVALAAGALIILPQTEIFRLAVAQ